MSGLIRRSQRTGPSARSTPHAQHLGGVPPTIRRGRNERTGRSVTVKLALRGDTLLSRKPRGSHSALPVFKAGRSGPTRPFLCGARGERPHWATGVPSYRLKDTEDCSSTFPEGTKERMGPEAPDPSLPSASSRSAIVPVSHSTVTAALVLLGPCSQGAESP